MRKGISLADLATEITRQADSKEDFILDTRHLELVDPGAGPELSIAGHGVLPVQLNAHRQVGDRLKIPATYYDRLLGEAPDLLRQNVNHWFQRNPEIRMVRTLDGEVRAYLSDRYRPLEHCDLAEGRASGAGRRRRGSPQLPRYPHQALHQGRDRVGAGNRSTAQGGLRVGLPRRDGVPRDRDFQLRGGARGPVDPACRPHPAVHQHGRLGRTCPAEAPPRPVPGRRLRRG